MKRLLAVALIAAVAACGRKAEVRTSPSPVSATSAPAQATTIRVRNNLSEAANVYVNSGGNDIFVGQVQGNSTAELPVSGVAAGSSVTIRARTNSGTNYSKPNVTLTGMVDYNLP